MQAIEELALEGPFKLRMVQIAWVKFEIVGVDRHRRVLEADDHLYGITLGTGGEIQQGMFVEAKLFKHSL